MHAQTPSTEPGTAETAHVDAIVIGSGFSGLYMLRTLRDRMGLEVRVFEAGSGVGGAWYWNNYPGARCDSDSFVYCYSFDDELLETWQWSSKYPTQPEIRSYLEHVAEKHALYNDITFDTRVVSAHFDADSNEWLVTTDHGETSRCTYLITGLGHLAISPYTPSIPGIEKFEGESYHTGTWPRGGVDLTGKRVAVIGTGSSGVQAIPVIAEQAEHLVVYQRTPQYSVPAHNVPLGNDYWTKVRQNYPKIWAAAHTSAGGFPWQHNGRLAMEATEAERSEVYENLWQDGGIKFGFGSFKDIWYDLEANRTVSDFIRAKIRAAVQNPVVREALVPEHPFLSRRPIVDSHYFETYNRDDVTLVDLRPDPIRAIGPAGIETDATAHEVDVIVFATGFDAVTGPFFDVDFAGTEGHTIAADWSGGAQSYLGLQTAHYPNMFTITGPQSTLGNLPVTIETHVEWVAAAIEYMRDNGIRRMEASPKGQKAWTEEVQAVAENTMMSQTDSWYNGSNIPGKASSYVFYLGHFGHYRKILQTVAERGYPGFILDGELQPVDPSLLTSSFRGVRRAESLSEAR